MNSGKAQYQIAKASTSSSATLIPLFLRQREASSQVIIGSDGEEVFGMFCLVLPMRPRIIRGTETFARAVRTKSGVWCCQYRVRLEGKDHGYTKGIEEDGKKKEHPDYVSENIGMFSERFIFDTVTYTSFSHLAKKRSFLVRATDCLGSGFFESHILHSGILGYHPMQCVRHKS